MRPNSRRRAAGQSGAGFDPYSFTVSFKGVFLEGLEVVFIVLTFGANQHRVGLAAIAAAAAVLLVVIAGLAIHAPLARVPENTMKFGVGVMLDVVRDVLERRGRGRALAWFGCVAARLDSSRASLLAGRRRDDHAAGGCSERGAGGGGGGMSGSSHWVSSSGSS